MHALHVPIRQLFSVHCRFHMKVEFSRPNLLVLKLIWSDEPRSERCGEVFRFCWTEPDLHFSFLDISGAPVVHYRVSGDMGLRVFFRDIRSEDHTSELQSLTNLVCR